MTPDVKDRIRAKVRELGQALGRTSANFSNDDLIPATGLLDSASIMALILWYEEEFHVSTDEEDLTLDNFGTVNLMADYLARHRRG